MLASPERGSLKSEEGEYNGKESDQASEEVHQARSHKALEPSLRKGSSDQEPRAASHAEAALIFWRIAEDLSKVII
jgi:hypothetical protein